MDLLNNYSPDHTTFLKDAEERLIYLEHFETLNTGYYILIPSSIQIAKPSWEESIKARKKTRAISLLISRALELGLEFTEDTEDGDTRFELHLPNIK